MIDIQEHKPSYSLKVRAGVNNLLYPLKVEGQHTVGSFSITVAVPSEHKGTHMSRMVEVVRAASLQEFSDVQTLVSFLQEEVQGRFSHCAEVKFQVEFVHFHKVTAPSSKEESLLPVSVSLTETGVTLRVPVTSLCPCSKAISDYGAHNQRGYVYVTCYHSEFGTFSDVIKTIRNSASAEIYPLLKRVDERVVTMKAYDNPVFVEDIVRNLAVALKERGFSWFRLRVENQESIHDHTAIAYYDSKEES